MSRSRRIERVLLMTFVLNEGVALLKIAAGYATHSVGMVSDGFHSLFDGVSNLVGIVGIRIAAAPPDREHPYGHRKYETLFSIAVGIMIIGTCYEIFKHAFLSLGDSHETTAGAASFIVMAATVGVNLFVMVYERDKGRELGSEFLVADAMHTKSNIMASLAVVIGLVLTRAGYPAADAVAGIVLSIFIAKIGIEIIRDASGVLVDTSSIDVAAIERVACAVEGVLGCHAIRTRGPEGHVYVDMHIQLDPALSLREAHAISHRVKDRILEEFASATDVVVHAEPYKGPI